MSIDLSFKFASENDAPVPDAGCGGSPGVGFDRIVWVAGMSKGAGRSVRCGADGDPEVEDEAWSVEEVAAALEEVGVDDWKKPFTARILGMAPTSLSGGDTEIAGARDSPRNSPLLFSPSDFDGFRVRSDDILPWRVGTSEVVLWLSSPAAPVPFPSLSLSLAPFLDFFEGWLPMEGEGDWDLESLANREVRGATLKDW